MLNSKITVLALAYGDHVDLAQRCFGSLRPTQGGPLASVRIGLNVPCLETRDYVYEKLPRILDSPLLVYEPGFNALKYPLMRKMLYDPERPIDTPYVMWFDDDSCVHSQMFWPAIAEAMVDADVLGEVWSMQLQGNQALGIANQPWYTGRKFVLNKQGRSVVHFATGGWWLARTQVVTRWNYPWPELSHNGGDTMFGAMLYQQRHRLKSFNRGVWVNADAQGRSSKAARRGVSRKPLWHDFVVGATPDLSHHDFQVKPVVFNRGSSRELST